MLLRTVEDAGPYKMNYNFLMRTSSSQVLFSTKFALWASEIASLSNICYANVKCSLRERRQISFHIATKEQYFTISERELFHIRRKANISLKIITNKFHKSKNDCKRIFYESL